MFVDPDLSLAPIVVGIDGGPGGDAALRWAVQFSQGRGRRLRVVLVVPPSTLPVAAFDAIPLVFEPDPFDAMVVLERCLERVVPERAVREGIEARVVVGTVAERLQAESEQASLLVVGRRSGRRVFGVARRLVTGAACPVVVVPPGAPVAALTPSEETVGRGPRSMAAAAAR
ncbi:MAG: universal stress protein [Acidimicrobiales bacterium]|nr:universal stress protein [Acidimicrobiales bacterium]